MASRAIPPHQLISQPRTSILPLMISASAGNPSIRDSPSARDHDFFDISIFLLELGFMENVGLFLGDLEFLDDEQGLLICSGLGVLLGFLFQLAQNLRPAAAPALHAAGYICNLFALRQRLRQPLVWCLLAFLGLCFRIICQ